MSNARNIANLPNGDDAPIYACRAWVLFNGNVKDGGGTPSSSGDDLSILNSSDNISSVDWISSGKYKINFSPSLGTVNYVISGSIVGSTLTGYFSFIGPTGNANDCQATDCTFVLRNVDGSVQNNDRIHIGIFY